MNTGKTAPDFALPDQNGTVHKLSDYRGRYVLIYFYPKDDTPGCTTEACTLRDSFAQFGKLNAHVFGISTDSVKSHDAFAKKFNLPFPLLADEDKKVVTAYDVWGTKKFMGREYRGISRTSFLIDPQGKIVKIYEKVKPETHAEDVLREIQSLA